MCKNAEINVNDLKDGIHIIVPKEKMNAGAKKLVRKP